MKNRTALFATIYPGVLPYLREWYQSVKDQGDQNFDLWIASDCLSQERVFESVGEEFYANWYHAAAGESPVTIRIHALLKIVEHYDVVILVDSDDILLPRRVEQSKRGIEKNDISACALDLINENGTPLHITAGGKFIFTGDNLFDFLLYRNIFGFSNMAFRVALLSQLLKTSSKCPALDWNFATRSTVMGARIHFDNLSGMMYRQHESNIARILPPFDKEILLRSSLMVLEHFRGLFGLLPPDMQRKAGTRHHEVAKFNQRIVKKPEVCQAYLEAVNTLHEEPYWWYFVAHPQLKEIWS